MAVATNFAVVHWFRELRPFGQWFVALAEALHQGGSGAGQKTAGWGAFRRHTCAGGSVMGSGRELVSDYTVNLRQRKSKNECSSHFFCAVP